MTASTSSKYTRWLLFAVVASLPLLTSCFSATIGGQNILRTPNFIGSPYLKFERMVHPCTRGSNVVVDDLYDGASAMLWKDRGDFYLIPNGDVEEAFYIYRTGGLRQQYHRDDRLGRPIYGPNWKLEEVRNSGTNAYTTLVVVVFYRGQNDPEVMEITIHNRNLREMCQGYK